MPPLPVEYLRNITMLLMTRLLYWNYLSVSIYHFLREHITEIYIRPNTVVIPNMYSIKQSFDKDLCIDTIHCVYLVRFSCSVGGHIKLFAIRPPGGHIDLLAMVFRNLIPIPITMSEFENLVTKCTILTLYGIFVSCSFVSTMFMYDVAVTPMIQGTFE